MPHPADLAGYESVVPGAGDRIIRIAENAAETRNGAITNATNAAIKSAENGQSFAFFLAFTAMVASIVFFALGNNIAGVALISFPVVMLVRSFLPGKDDSEPSPPPAP